MNPALIEVSVRFHGPLNDFLRYARRKRSFIHRVHSKTSVRDLIESLGVPHTEIGKTKINGHPASIASRLKAQNRIHLWPCQVPLKTDKNFVLDVHLGKLARYLRLLGINTLYRNDYGDHEIIRIAKKHNRIVLTRDIGLLKHKAVIHGYWIRSEDPKAQAQEVIHRFGLKKRIRPFTRCLLCNGKLGWVRQREVETILPQRTRRYFHRFKQCKNCRKVFWKGSHTVRMQTFIQEVMLGLKKRQTF